LTPIETTARVRIWDLPTRLFHWLLTGMVVFSFTTGKLGGNWVEWHFRSGYAILALLLFRLFWGVAGSHYARFTNFLPSSAGAWRALRSKGAGVTAVSAGHSEIGRLSVYALLVVLLLQVATGLFSNDGTFNEGPWARWVTETTSNQLSALHYYNHWMMVVLVAVHVAAVVFYLVRRQDLITPMLTGDKFGVAAPAAEDGTAIRLRALAIAVLASAIVYVLVML